MAAKVNDDEEVVNISPHLLGWLSGTERARKAYRLVHREMARLTLAADRDYQDAKDNLEWNELVSKD